MNLQLQISLFCNAYSPQTKYSKLRFPMLSLLFHSNANFHQTQSPTHSHLSTERSISLSLSSGPLLVLRCVSCGAVVYMAVVEVRG